MSEPSVVAGVPLVSRIRGEYINIAFIGYRIYGD